MKKSKEVAPWILRLIAVGVVVLIGSELFKSKKRFELTTESNCDDLLMRFNEAITIDEDKVERLRRAHYTIRDKLSNYFRSNTDLPVPSFFIQGSYKTKTLIENANAFCDVDLGVFFPKRPNVKIETLKNHIKNALTGHTSRGVSIKAKCVRLNYVRNFHIDLPIFYVDENTNKTFFGIHGHKWEPSEPKLFISWFNNCTKDKPQIVRVIRYLKAWSDQVKNKKGRKFPCGLALTIWAIQFYEPSKRDDVSLFHTCSGIFEYLSNEPRGSWEARMPVEPYDNTLDRLSISNRAFFYNEFNNLVSIIADAVSSHDKTRAMGSWRHIFGYRFS